MDGVLKNKKILLAVTGSIAAYKSAVLARLLQKKGAAVRVIMTPSATRFISPLTFSTLTAHPVFTDMMQEGQWNSHVELGLWADIMLIAPLTANTLSKISSGQADNMVGATYLSAKCPVFVAPAMDLDMWKHPATQRNLARIQADGVGYIPVEFGLLASGLTGDGRMAEPEHIVSRIEQFFAQHRRLSGKKILITAGPTREALDPIRFISNHSTGTMGIALANTLTQQGAEVHLVLGPTAKKDIDPDIKLYRVESAEDMYDTCMQLFEDVDVAIMAAAVADYTPARYSETKIKKSSDDLSIPLRRTKDIALELGQRKKPGQYLIGFALETNDEIQNIRGKNSGALGAHKDQILATLRAEGLIK